VSLVLDPSLALSWYFEDERTSAANALLDQVADQGAIVPGLWRLEIANGLRTAIRRKRIDTAFRDRAIAQLACLPIPVDPDTRPLRVDNHPPAGRPFRAHSLRRRPSGTGAAPDAAACHARRALARRRPRSWRCALGDGLMRRDARGPPFGLRGGMTTAQAIRRPVGPVKLVRAPPPIVGQRPTTPLPRC
jgi:hypothetical protein